jgi:hypothetical protein
MYVEIKPFSFSQSFSYDTEKKDPKWNTVIAGHAFSGLNEEIICSRVLRYKIVCGRYYWEIWEPASPALYCGL